MNIRTAHYISYVLWAVLALAVVIACMRARQPHWGLFVGALFLVAGMGFMSAGEVAPWAARRGIQRPTRFAIRVWLVGSFAWAAYIALVSLPIAFLTNIPSTKPGRDLLGVITFLPLPLFYTLAWWAYARLVRHHTSAR
ncbi:MAG: hypothetical protein EXR67_03090 [Dehalococcoidia bacterium]|nr:hypothetical protein [Dehalococcoidia bacterium]